jgi:outer membrane protein assembly factor BamA
MPSSSPHPRPIGTLLIAIAFVLLAMAAVAPDALARNGPDRTLRLERIVVEPPSSGLEAAVGELLGLTPGDEVDTDTLLAARRRLQLSGWFEEVEVYTERGSVPGLLVLRVDTRLNKGVRLETGFGHDPLRGWTLKLIGLRAHHVLGPANTVTLGWQLGPRRSMLEADYIARRLAGLGFDLLVHFEGGGEEWNAFEGEDFFRQRIARTSLALGTRWHHTGGLSTTLWLGASAADPGNIDQLEGERRDPPADLVGPPRGQENYNDLGVDLTLDRRDLAQPWRRGLWSTLQLRGSRVRGGDRFGRARAAMRAAFPLPGENALAWRIDGAWSEPSTPYHLRPIFGGQGTVRGFRDASLSGGEGARAIFATALEWRVPLLPRADSDARVHGALFVDTGTWIDADGSSNDWATSVGWGLRVRLPWIQRLSIDMGVPLTPTVTGDPFWVHFGLGFGF